MYIPSLEELIYVVKGLFRVSLIFTIYLGVALVILNTSRFLIGKNMFNIIRSIIGE